MINLIKTNSNNEIKNHIENMLAEYRENGSFQQSSLDQLLELADFAEYEVSRLINKFHYINTKIANNGGVPVLKQAYALIYLARLYNK